MKHITIISALIFLSSPFWTKSQVISISDARAKSIGSTVTVKAIVTNGDELGTIRYIQDHTAGIGIYDYDLNSLKRGDSVELTGELTEYNNLLEISNVSNFNVINSGNPLPNPKEVDFSTGFSEAYEGQLVKFRDVSFQETGNFKGNWNYDVKQGISTAEVRINKTTNIVSTQIPQEPITIVGIMSQYKTTYQLMPRDLTDLNQVNSAIVPVEIGKDFLSLYFETNEAGKAIMQYGRTPGLEMGEVKDDQSTTKHTIEISGLNPATFYYVRALSVKTAGDTVKSGLFYFSTASESSGEIITYFNKPVDKSYAIGKDAIVLNRAIDDTLVAYIDRAKQSIDLAVYNLNNQGLSVSISQALNNAHNRGVRVRVVADGNTANLGIDDLTTGIPVIKSPESSLNYKLMHNKFLIFDAISNNPDEPLVWTGSTNLTDGQINRDPNNVIIIQDEAIAKAYQMEFEEMWGSSSTQPNKNKARFGKFKEDNTPHFFNVGGKLVELYFSPSDNVTYKIIDAIETVDESMYFATFVFTRTEIAYPMTDQYDEGAYIAGIFGDIGGSNAPAYNLLSSEIGSDIREYTGSDIFHHKYAIIDYAVSFQDLDPIVITGSHNWSSSANNYNDENTLMIHDLDVAAQYFQEWAQRFKDEGGTVFVSRDDKTVLQMKNGVLFYSNGQEMIVKLDAEKNENVQFYLYDLNGKRLVSTKTVVIPGENQLSFEIPELTEGIYIVRLIANDWQVSEKVWVR